MAAYWHANHEQQAGQVCNPSVPSRNLKHSQLTCAARAEAQNKARRRASTCRSSWPTLTCSSYKRGACCASAWAPYSCVSRRSTRCAIRMLCRVLIGKSIGAIDSIAPSWENQRGCVYSYTCRRWRASTRWWWTSRRSSCSTKPSSSCRWCRDARATRSTHPREWAEPRARPLPAVDLGRKAVEFCEGVLLQRAFHSFSCVHRTFAVYSCSSLMPCCYAGVLVGTNVFNPHGSQSVATWKLMCQQSHRDIQ